MIATAPACPGYAETRYRRINAIIGGEMVLGKKLVECIAARICFRMGNPHGDGMFPCRQPPKCRRSARAGIRCG